jgi:hypothetical protein
MTPVWLGWFPVMAGNVYRFPREGKSNRFWWLFAVEASG